MGTDSGLEIRLVGDPGSVLVFSGAQLHSTVPNTSGGTRFSVIRVERDSTQRLWSFALDGSDPQLMLAAPPARTRPRVRWPRRWAWS